ncbi:MAG: endonuclease, partial [Oscillospiraceae bacterium]|nr:endonuclease [Oscillospiraceae bacterium]
GLRPGQERFTWLKALGENYTQDAITTQIKGEYVRAPHIGKAAPDTVVNLIRDIENSVKAQQSAGLSRWTKVQNLKEAAKTLNFLTENNLLRYADLEAKTGEVSAAFDKTADTLKTIEKRLSDMAVLMKHITVYQQTKPAYDGLKTAKNKNTYRREHESTLIVHEAAAKALKAFTGDSGKLPNPAALKAEYEQLTERKTALNVEYKKVERQAREYGIIKRNVDSILNPGPDKAQGKEIEI